MAQQTSAEDRIRKKAERKERKAAQRDHSAAKFLPIVPKPRSKNQTKIIDAFDRGEHLLIKGTAGTGKTFLALSLALDEIMGPGASPFKKVLIIRSLVQTRDMGFLPGSAKEKIEAYEAAYAGLAAEIFNRDDAYDMLKNKGIVEFMATSFLRGLTFRDMIVIVDECQNMDKQELHTVMTRVGENCQVIFIGDTDQDDLTSERRHEKTGFPEFTEILQKLEKITSITMTIEDIQRSGLVKEYLMVRAGLK